MSATRSAPVAVHFCRSDYVYWDEERDALKWPGGMPLGIPT